MRCKTCGAEVKPGLTVCPECGATVGRSRSFRRMVRCRSCQARVPSGLNICPYCGATLKRSWRPFFLTLLTLIVVASVAYLWVNYALWDELRSLADRVQPPSVAFLATHTFTPVPSPTRTTTRTVTPSSTFTLTPVPPTETPTAPPPTATRPAAPTSTPTPRLTAPRLLSPDHQREFSGGGSQIKLRWEPAGVLADDEWYALSLRFLTDGVLQYSGTWTKETSWIVPTELHAKAGQHERAFQWEVTVAQQTGSKPDGGREGVALGPTSEMRTFMWC